MTAPLNIPFSFACCLICRTSFLLEAESMSRPQKRPGREMKLEIHARSVVDVYFYYVFGYEIVIGL